jgi:protein farnesyltransferase/geranylgeranyltransferase type-1 subunit alpha
VVDVAVKSSHAIEWLADVYAEEDGSEEGSAAEAVKMLTLLKEKYDPIRRNYWEYRIRQITVSAAHAMEVSASA